MRLLATLERRWEQASTWRDDRRRDLVRLWPHLDPRERRELLDAYELAAWRVLELERAIVRLVREAEAA